MISASRRDTVFLVSSHSWRYWPWSSRDFWVAACCALRIELISSRSVLNSVSASFALRSASLVCLLARPNFSFKPSSSALPDGVCAGMTGLLRSAGSTATGCVVLGTASTTAVSSDMCYVKLLSHHTVYLVQEHYLLSGEPLYESIQLLLYTHHVVFELFHRGHELRFAHVVLSNV